MGTVHVVPLHDQVQHVVPGLVDFSEWEQQAKPSAWLTVQVHLREAVPDLPCACGPSTELVANDDGPDGWMVVHHSLDGREQHEHS